MFASVSAFASASICVYVCASCLCLRLHLRDQCSHLGQIACSEPCSSRRRPHPTPSLQLRDRTATQPEVMSSLESRISRAAFASEVDTHTHHPSSEQERVREQKSLDPTSPPSPYLTLMLKLKLALPYLGPPAMTADRAEVARCRHLRASSSDSQASESGRVRLGECVGQREGEGSRSPRTQDADQNRSRSLRAQSAENVAIGAQASD